MFEEHLVAMIQVLLFLAVPLTDDCIGSDLPLAFVAAVDLFPCNRIDHLYVGSF